MEKILTCPETGRILRRGKRTLTARFGGMRQSVEVAGWYSDDANDDNGVLQGSDLANWTKAGLELRTQYGARIRKIRKKLGLTQEEAGRIIGGGKRAFQKYESGKMPPSDAAIGLIEILARHPEEIETLRALRA